MKNASSRGLEVFDFTEEDELPELISEKRLSKFKNPNSETNAVLEYEFLECVAHGSNVEEKVGSLSHVDVDLDESRHNYDISISHVPSSTAKEQFTVDTRETGNIVSKLGKIGPSSQKPTMGLNCTLPQFAASQQADVFSDAKESLSGSSQMSPPSEIVEDSVLLNSKCSDYSSSDTEMDDLNKEVVFRPDYIVYEDYYCAGPLLTFSHNGIKINGFTDYGSNQFLNLKWGVDDVVDIECQWFQRVETVIIKLRVISRDARCNTSGIKEVKIAVVDSYWAEKQEKIKSLDSKYLAVWNMSLNADIGTDGEDLHGQRHYFPNFDEPFEEVVYPKGDPDAVSIGKRDVDLLQPETFVNDTIIDFYIQYLKSQIEPEEKHRFHFFNSFFFRKLADLDKDPSSASDGRAAFLRVRKWTRKVDLFGKDYIFIPINFNLHWSLMVICHPGEVARYSDEDLAISTKVPCILHMDSIKGSHTGLKNLIQSYLLEEWKERHKEVSEDVSSKFNNLRFLPLELPQQENSFDCGLFLLHYLELFLTEAPLNFSPFKLSKFSKFLNVDWFPPAEAYLKRTLIQRLIFEILENRSGEISKPACSDELLSKFPANNDNETGVELLPERGSPAIMCHQNLSNSQSDDGIEITLLSESSTRSNQFTDNSGLVVRELFETGASNGSLPGHYQSFAQTSSYYDANGTVLEEDEEAETADRFMYLPPEPDNFQPVERMTPPACSFPCSSRGFECEASSFDESISMQPEQSAIASSPESSSHVSDDLEDVGINESSDIQEASPCKKEGTNRKRSLPVENLEPVARCFISTLATIQEEDSIIDSQDVDNICEVIENGDHDSVCKEKPLASPDLDDNITNKTEVECVATPVVDSYTDVELQEEHAAKKLRRSPYPEEQSNGVTEGLSNSL